jgi:succinyl-diaminopimelate desuccinylase
LEAVLTEAGKVLTGFKFKKFTSNGNPSVLYYNTPELPKKFKVIMNAHLDVVAAREDQYHPFEKDGRLYGRGAIDMKAAGAAEILAFAEIAKKVNYSLGLQLVTDEEIGGKNGTKYQISQRILTDFYLCGEYSHLGIGNQTKGVLWLKLISHGKRSHGAYPWKGENAIYKLAKEINQVSKLFPAPKKEVWKTTCNFGQISGGIATNQVPDEAFVMLDIRRVPSETADSLIAKIKSKLIFSDTEIQIIENEPVNFAPKNNPFIKTLSQSIHSVTHQPVKFVRFHGASDARHYSASGCTAIDIGPSGEGLHSDNEWVDIKSLEDYYQILNKFLTSF